MRVTHVFPDPTTAALHLVLTEPGECRCGPDVDRSGGDTIRVTHREEITTNG